MRNVPAPRPCGTCPYRVDVPSGVWAVEEYERLVAYDADTGEQPPGLFYCHQQDGRLCAGWVGCHDMDHSLALRLAAAYGRLSPAEVEAIRDYRCAVPLFGSGADAARHGVAEIASPSPKARRAILRLLRKIGEREHPRGR